MSKQFEIAQQIVDELKDDPSIVAVNIFGSTASGEERPESDIDIEIVSSSELEWRMAKEMRDGIEVDYVYTPKDFLLKKVREYPFLSYVHTLEVILLDRDGTMSQVQDDLHEYFSAHPEVREYWEEVYRNMRIHKENGTVNPVSGIEAYDEAERRFSPSHAVTRTFWRE